MICNTHHLSYTSFVIHSLIAANMESISSHFHKKDMKKKLWHDKNGRNQNIRKISS